MAKKIKTQGWYLFEDGTYSWFHGLSARERAQQVREHGKIISFEPTC